MILNKEPSDLWISILPEPGWTASLKFSAMSVPTETFAASSAGDELVSVGAVVSAAPVVVKLNASVEVRPAKEFPARSRIPPETSMTEYVAPGAKGIVG